MIKHLMVASCLMGSVAVAGHAETSAAEQLVLQRVQKSEKIDVTNPLFDPEFISRPDAAGGEYVLLTSAVGKPLSHGIRSAWLYQVKGTQAKRIFKFPFDAKTLSEDQPPVAKGFYWIYDCFICDSPESGYMYKVPVMALLKHGHALLTVDATGPERDALKSESRRTVQNALQKYKTPDKELLRLKRQVPVLFTQGLEMN